MPGGQLNAGTAADASGKELRSIVTEPWTEWDCVKNQNEFDKSQSPGRTAADKYVDTDYAYPAIEIKYPWTLNPCYPVYFPRLPTLQYVRNSYLIYQPLAAS